jgi:hypothetical protein
MFKARTSGIGFLLLLTCSAWADYPSCPNVKNKSELENWKNAAAATAAKASPSGLASVNNAVPKDNPPDFSVALQIEQCFPQKIPDCLQRIHSYSQPQGRDAGELQETDEDKLNRLPPPEFLAPGNTMGPNANFQLFQGTPGTPNYKDIEEIAKAKGWPMVRYKSRLDGGFDLTPSLLMIRVEGASLTPPSDYDRYINIPLPQDPGEDKLPSSQVNPVPQTKIPSDYSKDIVTSDPNDRSGTAQLPKALSIISVKRAKGDSPAEYFFNIFNRKPGTPFFKTREPAMSPVFCYACHANGLRAISPLGYDVTAAQQKNGQVLPDDLWKATREMNSAMLAENDDRLGTWGTVKDPQGKLRPVIDPVGLGPFYGPETPFSTGTRTQNFIVGEDGKSGCAYSIAKIDTTDKRAPGRENVYNLDPSLPINWRKVRNAMSCASCHDNESHGSLNQATDTNHIHFKIVGSQSMPLGAHLSPLAQGSSSAPVVDSLNENERIALANCLDAEFQLESTHTVDWLKEISCSAQ